MTIHFEQKMNKSINTSLINDTNTWIFVMPANNREDFDDFNIDDVSLTWKIVYFFETQLFIQLNFTKPQHISPLTFQDSLVIYLNGS